MGPLPAAHERLRGEALSQLDALRDTLGLVPTSPARTPEEIAPELALVQATLKRE